MLHRFWTTLAVAAACLCAAPAAPVAPAPLPDEPEPAFDAAPLPDDAAFARAARTDPLLMLRLAAKRCRIAAPEGDKEAIAGYSAAFHKRERIGGALEGQHGAGILVDEQEFVVQAGEAFANAADGAVVRCQMGRGKARCHADRGTGLQRQRRRLAKR